MHIAIDLTALLPTTTGVDRFLVEFVLGLGEINSENRYTVFVNRADVAKFRGRLPANFRLRAWTPRSRIARLLFQQLVSPLICAICRVDVLHSPSFLMPLMRGRQRHLLSVHDMTFFSMPQVHTKLRGSAQFRAAVARSIRRADRIVVPAQAVCNDLLALLPDVSAEKVYVTPYGVHERFSPAEADEVSAQVRRLGLPEAYLLYLGTIEPRKNLEPLLDAYSMLVREERASEHLVLAGRLGWNVDSLLRRLDSHELRGRVHLLGYVREEDVPWLYRGARVFVYPSLYEGFGFPPLEAMACGTPVVAARGSALEENLTGAAELVPVEDAGALKVAISGLLNDRAVWDSMRRKGLQRAAGFRWERTARGIRQCYLDLAAPPDRAAGPAAQDYLSRPR